MTRTCALRVNGTRTVATIDGRGRPLLLVPGLGCSARMYRRAALALAPHFEVWRYDPPGHGRSGGGLDRISALSEHLVAFMRAADLTGAPLLGHSLGGEIALDIAAHHPELTPALVLVAPTGIPEHPDVLRQTWHLAQDAMRERLSFVPLAVASYLRCGPRRLWALTRDQSRHASLPNLERARQPTLIMLGGRDPIVSRVAGTAMQALLRDPQVCCITGAAHAITDSHPVALAREVQHFLKRHGLAS